MLIWSDLQMRKCYINRNAYEFLILTTNALCAVAFIRSSFLDEHFNYACFNPCSFFFFSMLSYESDALGCID